MLGRANPLAPPIELRLEDGRIIGRATFGAAYEGPPGCVHGGFVAAAFDEVLGSTQSLSGAPGMTGRLTVHYRSPTPLHTPLRFEGSLESVSGRKILTKGTLWAGDVLCAEAEGLFITIDFAKFAELKARRDEQQQRAVEGDRLV
jgi:acyl-coenzyme A thioesterase PaaI-like protein